MQALEVENVSKSFGSFLAVNDLSFSIPQGTIYGLLGPNGAGKTTTIRMVMNIIIPDQGFIHVLGQKMNEHMKEKVGYLPEDRGLYPKMKVEELLFFLSALKGLKRDEVGRRIDYWLDRFDLGEWKNKKVEELSRGMQQKIQFIVTVIHRPDLIILDEPFGGLDPVNTKLLKDIMLEMKKEGHTIIFSTHRMEQVEMICENICLINRAKKVLEGSLNQIKKQYGKNTLLLDYEGEGHFIHKLSGVEHIDDYGKFMEIRLADTRDPQNLLKELAEKVRINRFEVKQPSLNAIFIDKVGDKNAKDPIGH
ncbi:ABC transporter ATP-binding protein [bacterium]|nr:ABC transporter ATP-binding protein [bacterium]